MKLKDIMTHQVETVSPDTTVREAAFKMKDLDVGPMPVCEGRRVVGMLTDRDIVIRSTAQGQDPNAVRVREVMTPNVVSCREDDDVKDAARTMRSQQIRRVVVLDGKGELCGIVSLADVAVDTGDEKLSGKVLEDVSEPALTRS